MDRNCRDEINVLARRRSRLSRGEALHDVDLGRHGCRVPSSLVCVSEFVALLLVAVWLVIEEDREALEFIEKI
jgi:hypothetical protein